MKAIEEKKKVLNGELKIVSIGTSNRHVHLTQKSMIELFGTDELTIFKELSQPGQFATKETVELIWPEKVAGNPDSRPIIKWVRIIWPDRPADQIELSMTDARALWIKNVPIRLSGVLSETPWIIVRWPKWQIETKNWVIISQKHIHIESRRAKDRGIKNDDMIAIWVKTWPRSWVMMNVVVRVSDST
jgi:putative phosphotransacetylase